MRYELFMCEEEAAGRMHAAVDAYRWVWYGSHTLLCMRAVLDGLQRDFTLCNSVSGLCLGVEDCRFMQLRA